MTHLTREQRYTISAMLQQNYKQIDIAKAIGKSKSVISREIHRNKNNKGKYSFTYAQMCVDVRKERYRTPRKFNKEVEDRIKELLAQRWSPEQIVGHCKRKNLKMVSCEMIYRYIREDKQRGGELYKYCRHRLKHRKRPVGGSFPIKDRVSIDLRPPEADGTRFGDWEMDLIIGKGNKDAMLTLVERSTGFSIIENLPYGKNSRELSKVVVRALLPYKQFIKTITTDNGGEFADHKTIARKLNTQIYFAHPYSSWEKGLIEYTNKLYRQYIPKDAKLKDYNDQQIKNIQYEINNRPRKKLNFAPPKQMFFVSLN
ncbi:MAG: IS30 family transposase [Rikenellaceae bacterium]